MQHLFHPFRYRGYPATIGILLLSVPLAAQTLAYTVTWLGVPVVDVTITVTEGDSITQAEYHARTRSWFDPLYSVDNRYQIWVNATYGQPVRYAKQIKERGHQDSLGAVYLPNRGKVIYANGLERDWSDSMHSFFSALLWVQRYEWVPDEQRDILVEVEGVVWKANLQCNGIDDSTNPADLVMLVTVRFEEPIQGEPVLSTTDILTHMLPGEGNVLRFGLNLDQDRVEWVEYGFRPLLVRAVLDSS